MVSQVVCAVCSLSPEVNTTEITFHKFPNATEQPDKIEAWKAALSNSKNKKLLEGNDFSDTFICSRHFTATDFSFDSGKLILKKDAVPTRMTDVLAVDKDDEIPKTEKSDDPPKHGNNFARTPTVDYMTTSRHHFGAVMMCTGTSRALTPTVSEYRQGGSNDSPYVVPAKRDEVQATNKRNADLEHKIQDFQKIFKRLRHDNVLTESYVIKLKVFFTFF